MESRRTESEQTSAEVSVVIVSDDPLARAGLASLMGNVQLIKLAGQERSDISHEGLIEAYGNPVVAWDLDNFPGEAFSRIGTLAGAGIRVLALVYDKDQSAQALASGAMAVLPRESNADALTSAIIAVSNGLLVIDKSFAKAFLPNAPESSPLSEPLTQRETDVLSLMADGLPNKVIAQRLKISEHTVKFHINSILTKLSSHSRTEAVTRAAKLGLIVL